MEKQFECVKIKDGLYIGNRTAAFDLQFLVINKFEYIINCATEIPNAFEEHGIKYLKFKLSQEKHQKIFDEDLKRLHKLEDFIQIAEDNAMCCLIHSNKGNNRSLLMAIAYLMTHFKWNLRKCFQYIQSKAIFIALTENYIQQLSALEAKLLKENHFMSENWAPPFFNSEDQLLTKTYINSKYNQNQSSSNKKNVNHKQSQYFQEIQIKKDKLKRVQWQDKIEKEKKKQKQQLKKKLSKQFLLEKQKQQHQKMYASNQRDKHKKSNLSLTKQRDSLSKKYMKRFQISEPEIANKKDDENPLQKMIKKAKAHKLQKQLNDLNREQLQNLQFLNEESHKVEKDEKQLKEEQKKVYKLTINNFINPNINIISKPPLPSKPKAKNSMNKVEKNNNIKKEIIFSEKDSVKKMIPAQKIGDSNKQKYQKPRASGNTPTRERKQRKSDKNLKFLKK